MAESEQDAQTYIEGAVRICATVTTVAAKLDLEAPDRERIRPSLLALQQEMEDTGFKSPENLRAAG